MFNKVLVLSPHTDDAELGCGGTIARFIEEKKDILWIVFSTAEQSLPEGLAANTLEMEFKEVINKLGLKDGNFVIHNFKVRHLHSRRQDVLEELIKVRDSFGPELVVGPSLNDFHQDHTVVANEMIRAFKSNCCVICYELPWNHIKFDTQFFMRLREDDIEKKIEMLKSYKSQLMKKRHYFTDEFVRGLASTRGAQIDTRYAEAFEVVRWII